MRLISQNGMFDVPYDNFCVEIIRGKEIMVFNNQSDLLDEAIIMATYSTNEKALKVMEMLRNQYAKIEMIKVLSCGTCEYMDKSLNKEEEKNIFIDYCKQNIFQFPKDEEVEV